MLPNGAFLLRILVYFWFAFDNNISNDDIDKYNSIITDIISFTREESLKLKYIDNSFNDNSWYCSFKMDIYNKKIELLKTKNPFASLYVRVMQNTDSVLYTLHFLNCYYKGNFSPIIDNSIIELATEYMNTFLANYDNLIDEILNYKDLMQEELENRVIEKMNELLNKNGSCTLREIYKPLKIPANKAKLIVKSYVKQYSDRFILEENSRSINIIKKTKRQ